MIRNLHLKLVLILVLLIISVMTVVGTYLLNSVSMFYIDDFGSQMSMVFKQEFYDTLQREGSQDDGLARMKDVLTAYSGLLGINNNRHYYILDGMSGGYLAGSEAVDRPLELTKNILTAINGRVGIGNSVADSWIDFALPVKTGDTTYIVYIKDSGAELDSLTRIIFAIIIQAVFFGLVIAIAMSFLLSKAITNPVENLTRGARRIATGDFTQIEDTSSRDEIGILTNTFNNMARQLQHTLQAVEEERDKLSTLFLHMTDGMAAFDRQAQIININPAAENMLGVPFDETLDYKTVLGAAGVPIEEIFEIAPPGYIEAELTTGGKSLRVFLAPFGRDENEGGVMAVIHDVTEQVKLEAARREFVANVSHELRTPLTNVKSYTETLMSESDIQPDVRNDFLKVILNETDRMTRIVKDLLTLSRLDYGKLEWNLERFDISRLLNEVVDAMRGEASQLGHKIELDIADGIPEMTGDRERIQQVVVNVVSNALKYTPDGGLISINASCGNNRLVISVSDNGIGIPEGDQPRLFERFYRVDKGRSREMGGTGLGLAIAKDIIDYHKGSVSVESEIGVGTTVTIELPLDLPMPI